MSRRGIEIAVPTTVQYRDFPPAVFAENARQLQASGVVDYLQCWDQLTGWWPHCLWTKENTPLAALMPDPDSYADVFALSAYGAAAAPDLGVMISTDAIRRGPAELNQTMYTLAGMTGGRAMFHLGAGEVKQAKPFGWKRAEGLARLEDQFRIFHEFWNNDHPFDFRGNHWTFDQAWLGAARPHRPTLWTLGGGPKLIDIATSYGDGFAMVMPGVFGTAERMAEQIAGLKRTLEAKGRDPENFGFGVYAMTALHDDPAVIEGGLTNPLMQWITAIWGRLNMRDWEREGIEPAFPPDWHYAINLLPMRLGTAEVDAVLSKVTPEMSRKGWITGDPAQVAAQLQAYVDAGATWIGIFDFLPVVLPLDDAQNSLPRTLEVARILKRNSRHS